MKTVINVFPDYCSTGFWSADGVNIECPTCVPLHLAIAVRYWHEIWEFVLRRSASESYRRRWLADGHFLVNEINRVQNTHVFTMTADYDYTAAETLGTVEWGEDLLPEELAGCPMYPTST